MHIGLVVERSENASGLAGGPPLGLSYRLKAEKGGQSLLRLPRAQSRAQSQCLES